jgi:hypothetical protein
MFSRWVGVFSVFSVFSSVAKISHLETYFPNMGVRALESP